MELKIYEIPSQIQAALAECRAALDRVEAAPGAQADLEAARRALARMEKMER